ASSRSCWRRCRAASPPTSSHPTGTRGGQRGVPSRLGSGEASMSRLRSRGGGRAGASASDEAEGPPVDDVTGLRDRTELLTLAEAAIRRSLPTSSRAAVVFVGIDQLRDVNDSFGPDTGDLLLKAVAERLLTLDLPNTQVLRYEGAEFVLVF